MTTRIKLRRDTAANWLESNPILAAGEPGLETDTGKIKYGDGVTAYALLPHAGGDLLANEAAITLQAGDDTKWLVQLARDDFDSFGGTSGVATHSVIYDNDGNVVIVGSISQNSNNVFIAKYTPAGVCLWKKTYDQVSNQTYSYLEGGLAVDSQNNIIVSIDWESNEFNLLKIDTNGAMVWIVNFAGNDSSTVISGIAVDSHDDILITTWNPSPGGLIGVNKIDKDTGGVVWTKDLGASGMWAMGMGIAVDYLNNVIVSGYQEVSETNSDTQEIVVAKFDNTGNLTWQKKLIMSDSAVDKRYVNPANVSTDTLGNIYVTGNYLVQHGNSDNDNNQSAGTSMAVFVAKLNLAGVVQWSRRAGPGPCEWTGLSTAVGSDGDLYLAAATTTYANQLSDNSQYEKGNYEHNLVIARYMGATGEVVWQKYFNNKHQQIYTQWGGLRSIDVRDDKLLIGGGSQFAEDYGFYRNGQYYQTAWVAQLSTDGSVGFDLADFSFADSRVPGRTINITSQANSSITVSNGSAHLVNGNDSNWMVDAVLSTRTLRSKFHTWTFDSEGNTRAPAEGNIVLDQTELGYINFIGYEYNDMDNIWLQSVVGDADGYTYAIGADYLNIRRTTIYKFDPVGKTVWVTQLRSGSGASFNVSRDAGVYTIDQMLTGGNNYRVGDVVIIQGWDMYGDSPANDLLIEVLSVDASGTILTYAIQSGVALAGTGGVGEGLEDNNDNGESRPNAITIDPSTGNLVIVCEVYEYNDATSILKLVVDPESGAVLSNTELRTDTDNNLNPYDVQVNSAGVAAIAGQSYGEMVAVTTIDPESASGLGHMIVGKEGIAIANNNRIPGDSNGSDWYVGGTGINGRAYVSEFNEYTNVPVITIEGQGTPTFDLSSAGGSYTVATTVVNGGTGGYLPGHKLKVAGSLLSGVDGDNDAILQVITVDASGIITQADVVYGVAAVDAAFVNATATNYQVGSGATLDCHFSPVDGSIWYIGINTSGNNYTYGDALVIAGTNFAGGINPNNNLRLKVDYTSGGGSGSRGAIQSVASNGTGIYSDTLGGTINTDWLSLRINGYNSTDFAGTGTWTIYEALDGQAYIWTPTFQKSLGVTGGNDWFNTVVWQGTSTVYAAGASHNPTSGNDENIIVKLAADGTVAWKKQLTHTDYTYQSEIHAIGTHDDGVVAIGKTFDSSLDQFTTFMYKLANDGTLMWHKHVRLMDDSYPNSSLAIDPTNGDILVIQDGYNNNVDWNIIYLTKFDRNGNIIWKRNLFTGRGEGINEDNGYRAVSIAGDSFFLAGWSYWAQDYAENGFAARLPLDGTGLGEHGVWTYTSSDDNKVRTYDKTGTTTIVDHVILDQTATKIVTNNARYYYTDWPQTRVPVLQQVVRDSKGGAMVFADGTRQTTSAAISQQIRISTYYTITPNDSGAHIFIDSEDRWGNHYVYIPYWEFVKLPVGFKFSIINRSNQTVFIELQNGPGDQGQIFGTSTKNQGQYYQWYLNGNTDYGNWVDLIKVKEGRNVDNTNTGAEWVIRGDNNDFGSSW